MTGQAVAGGSARRIAVLVDADIVQGEIAKY